MPKNRVTLVIWTLIAACSIEAVWIVSNYQSPAQLSKIVLTVPFNEDVNVYGAEQDSGGATVPFVYHYFVHTKIPSEILLKSLSEKYSFLQTRTPASITIENGHIKVETHGQILDFSSRALYHHNGVKYVDIDLSARQPR
jgi:hypothetical protein